LQRIPKKIDFHDFPKPLSQSADSSGRTFVPGDSRELFHIPYEFLVVLSPRLDKTRDQLRSGQVVDRLDADDGGFPRMLTYHLCQPLEAFPVGWTVRKQVTGVAKRDGSIAL